MSKRLVLADCGLDTSNEDDLAVHRNTSLGDYQTKEQCADVFKYLLPYAKASSVSNTDV